MGLYLERIKGLKPADPNITFEFQNNTFQQAVTDSNTETGGWLGLGFLVTFWLGIYYTISKRENNFGLNPITALVSTNAIISTLAIIFLYTSILVSIQHFIWTILLLFFGLVIGMLRNN